MRILCLAVLAAASVAIAQDAAKYFLVDFELGAGVDIAHLTPPQMATFQQHGAQLMKLRDEGVVVMGGHTENIQHIRAFVVVKAKDAATAKTVADADPAVKAGMLKPSVEAFNMAIPPK